MTDPSKRKTKRKYPDGSPIADELWENDPLDEPTTRSGRFVVTTLVGLDTVRELSWEDRMRAGIEAYQRGDYKQAESHWRAGLDDAKKFGPNDPRLATSLNNLAVLPYTRGSRSFAEMFA